MRLDSAEDLIEALRASGLFTEEQFQAVVRELAAVDGSPRTMMRHLVAYDFITHYQLRKVLHGKAAELFVGRYVVADKIGEGGMGKVFRARRTDDGRTVALKVIRPALLTNEVVRGRYAREVQAAGRLEHPNIVHVFDAGEADGRFYLAMEFVDGIDLSQLMHEYGPAEVVEACEYVRQAALGLQHAHDRGFIHRDVKPSNVLVAGERHLPQATGPAVVKLLDLGLSRAIDPEDMVVPDLTRDHTVVGTPDYMAPEQAKSSKLVDHRADLYSLGCTFYYLLVGHPPFPNGNKLEKLMYHQLNQPPPVQGLRPEAPEAVADIIDRLLAKNPEDRIQSAAELAALLEPLAKYPEGAPPVPIRHARERGYPTDRTPETPLESGAGSSGSSPAAGSSSPFENSPSGSPVLAIAPSDKTPRPAALPAPLAVSEPPPAPPVSDVTPRPPARKRRRKPRRPPPRRGMHPALLVVLAALGAAVLAAVLWKMSGQ
jgi:serine/threonine-protein kinase